MKLPITIIERNGDRTSFGSVIDAQAAMEPIDVESGEFTAVDADGKTLSVVVTVVETPVLFGLWKCKVKTVRIVP
jgi:hypothetical protein